MKTYECDLVVIGSGGTGMVAAGHAATMGAKVIVLEKNKKPGGNTWFAVGTRYINSKRGRENGMGDLRDEMFRECMAKTQWRKDPRTVHRFLDSYAEVYDWFDSLGFDKLTYAKKLPNGMSVLEMPERKAPHKGTEPSRGPGFVGSTIVEMMLEVCEAHGTQILTGHRAMHLLLDDNGAFCGVVADHDGEEVRISAKGCVVGTGCFSANKELVTRAFPEHFAKPGYYACIGLSSATGDGIIMCEEVGAKCLDFVELGMPGLGHHPWAWNIHASCGRSRTMWINKNGERIADEGNVSMDAGKALAARQPDALIYSIVDQTILEQLQKECEETCMGNEKAYIGDLKEGYAKEAAAGKVQCLRGETLEELAQKMHDVAGVDGETFLKTVAEYNAACDAGHDPVMLKDPKQLTPIRHGPFYAALLQRFYEITQGGIEVDCNMQVRRAEGGVIPGLYAGGDTSSASGNSLNGTGLALAFVSGYVAADEACKKMGF
jgi:fumarate reductase flavoprotein subunit